jgi:DNA replication protein DnaC
MGHRRGRIFREPAKVDRLRPIGAIAARNGIMLVGLKAAQFRELKLLDDFDWSFSPSISRKQIFDLATCRFVREARDVLFLGPPGTGKAF